MPRLPVDGKKVIEYRLTLGAKERELVQDAQWSYTFGQIGSTIGGIVSNPVFLLGLAGYIAFKLDQILDPNWREIVSEMTPDEVKNWLETQNLVGAGIGGFIGGVLGLGVGAPWLGAAIGSVLGSAAVEVGEAAVEEFGEVVEETMTAQQTAAVVSWMIRIHWGLKEMGEALQPGSHLNGDQASANGGGGGF
jgi:hypothetical protein